MSFVIVTEWSNTKWMINHIKIFIVIAIQKVVVQVKVNTLVRWYGYSRADMKDKDFVWKNNDKTKIPIKSKSFQNKYVGNEDDMDNNATIRFWSNKLRIVFQQTEAITIPTIV